MFAQALARKGRSLMPASLTRSQATSRTGRCLLEVSVKETLKCLAVTSFLTSHFMYCIVVRAKSLYLYSF